MRSNKWISIGIVILALIIGFFIGNYQVSSKKAEADKYPLLSKRLFVENQNDIVVNLAPLRADIREYLAKTGYDHSFYLEYLPSGVSIRIGDQEQLIGASLMKVPIVMDLYKAAESGEIDLEKEVLIDEQAVSSSYGELYKAGSGSKIKLSDAAKIALAESDNTAARVVLEQTMKYLPAEDRSLNFIDAEQKQNEDGTKLYIYARAYSSFFKCLYLSCFLDYENSQYLLDIMTKTPFDDQLVAGVEDKSVKVSHKIGTFDKEVTSDCGIVYQPNRPYLICAMINTSDEIAKEHIAEVSRLANQYIKNANKAPSQKN